MLVYVVGVPSTRLRALGDGFAFVDDLDGGAQVTFLGYPRSCLLAEFIMEMICDVHYSVMKSLPNNSFEGPILLDAWSFDLHLVLVFYVVVCLTFRSFHSLCYLSLSACLVTLSYI